MVLKQTGREKVKDTVWEWCKRIWYSSNGREPSKKDRFENDVKEYGTQALRQDDTRQRRFENDVKEYGTQANWKKAQLPYKFENDVKEYGTQAK